MEGKMDKERKKVLVLNPYYLPGCRFGGPQQTVINICDAYRERADIYLMTRNHDYQDPAPYPGIPANQWLSRDGIQIYYAEPQMFGWKNLKKTYAQFDTALTCGLWETNTVLLLLINRFFRRKGQRLYVAPMGVFSEGALTHKGLKKRAFLWAMKALGCFGPIRWSFSSAMEREEARRVLGNRRLHDGDVIAEDLPRRVDFARSLERVRAGGRKERELKIAFLSRIVPKKNLAQCAGILQAVPRDAGKITFDIYGFREDEAYWQLCREAFQKAGVEGLVSYRGSVMPDQAVETLRDYDCFLFPSKGENYGHVIYEALAAGCVPVLSDKTPWEKLPGRQCGFIAPLDDTAAFADALLSLLSSGRESLDRMRENAVRFAEEKYASALSHSGYDQIFFNQ